MGKALNIDELRDMVQKSRERNNQRYIDTVAIDMSREDLLEMICNHEIKLIIENVELGDIHDYMRGSIMNGTTGLINYNDEQLVLYAWHNLNKKINLI